MKTAFLLKTLAAKESRDMMRLFGDWKSFVRMHFIFAALESGLLKSLRTPCQKAELIDKMSVKRPDLLDAIIDVGLALGELSEKDGRYALKGKRSKSVISEDGDALAAWVQANVTYYNEAYRNAASRLKGGPRGDYLGDIAGLVARASKNVEPFVRQFVTETVKGNEPMRILEVGCGSGHLLRTAAKANPHVTGIGLDLEQGVVAQARKNLLAWDLDGKFQIVRGDIMDPPKSLAGDFGLITFYNLLYYIPPEVRPGLFRKLRGMLAPGGRLSIVNTMQSRGRDLVAANLNISLTSVRGTTPAPDLARTVEQLRESGFQKVAETRFMPGGELWGLTAV